jgi:acetyl-CoA carboxylase carboxyl transferase subunit alpha
MGINFLEFERPIAELEAKIKELRHVGDDNEINIEEEIERLEGKSPSSPSSLLGRSHSSHATLCALT